MATTQTFTVVMPSGLTNGVGKKISSTTAPGDLIHTSHATSFDEIYLTLFNNTTIAVNCTVVINETLEYPLSIPGDKNKYLVINGQRFTGSTTIKVYAASSNVIIADCIVNRIS